MKTEVDEFSPKVVREFVDGLDDVTAVKIHVALENRFNRKMKSKYSKNTPTPTATPCQYANTVSACVGTAYSQNNFSLSSIAIEPGYYIPETKTQEVPQQKGQKEDAMSDLDTARRHMDNRLYSIKNAKRHALKTQFGLDNVEHPKTFAEMKDRLLAGQFVLPTDDEDNAYGVSFDELEWRDPSVKKDRPGFDAAEKLLDAAAVKVKDAIWVKANAEDALALLEAFESSTIN